MRSMLHIVGFLRRVVTSIISFMSFTSFLLRLKRCKITAQTIKAPANLCALIIHSLYSSIAKFSPVNASRQIPQARAQTRQNLYITSTLSNANSLVFLKLYTYYAKNEGYEIRLCILKNNSSLCKRKSQKRGKQSLNRYKKEGPFRTMKCYYLNINFNEIFS